MPRAKCFDREEALQKAMRAFWARGYEATSVQDLVECMGINRGSLYDTFGDKHQLFMAALAQYTEASLTRGSALRQDGDSVMIITDFLFSFMYRTLGDPEKRGCFITNTTVERSAYDEECAQKIREYYDCIEKDFQDLIRRGQAAGEITNARSPEELASFFVGVMQGIRVLGKVRQEEAALRPMVEVALETLKMKTAA
ncbi:TetR/AcrR family transcriptional regulator [Sneathiella limimaris]|uniref:TetR/AcrR family transcriptional regulator n=1 Tax=Sneathiella limimaris TaxID=1964213 RepID=UPI00146D08FE|nr:TetR/AcrR family transcriptional regulator [Sneathiella limimaris]